MSASTLAQLAEEFDALADQCRGALDGMTDDTYRFVVTITDRLERMADELHEKKEVAAAHPTKDPAAAVETITPKENSSMHDPTRADAPTVTDLLAAADIELADTRTDAEDALIAAHHRIELARAAGVPEATVQRYIDIVWSLEDAADAHLALDGPKSMLDVDLTGPLTVMLDAGRDLDRVRAHLDQAGPSRVVAGRLVVPGVAR